MSKRIQLVHADPLPRGKYACDLCLLRDDPNACAMPVYDGCLAERNSYYAEVDDEPTPTE